MSNSSTSPQPLEQEQTRESDVVFDVSLSLNQETPNQPDPPQKSDPETLPPAAHNLDPEYNSPEEEEEEDEEGEEIEEQENPPISSGMPLRINPPITDHSDMEVVTLTSPSGRRGVTKRKKGKAKGKGKAKKQQAIHEKLQTLMTQLNPVPFIPTKILDFSKHEMLLKKLCLWDFVHIDFDRTIRVDLIAQLVASYNPKLRASYVNDYRFMVNRADLARAFKLPLPSKKERGNVGVEVDWDGEVLSDDSIAFILELMSDWVLLHEDMWMMPDEVRDWMKLIKDGHPEKVDWAGLLWLMVEKELKKGGQLKDCYYASHLQHLIKFQRGDLFLVEQPAVDVVEVDGEAKKEEVEEDVNEKNNVDDIGPIDSPREEDDPILEGPSTELTLGQDGEKEEESKGVEMMDAEKCKDSDEEVGEVEEQGQWLLDEKNDLGEHILQRCSAVNGDEYGSFEERKDEEEEMEREEDDDGEEDEEGPTNNFHVFSNDDGVDGEGFTGNLLEAVEGNRMDFGSQDQLHNHHPSSVDTMHHIASAPSFFNNSGKRVIEHDDHISHHSLNEHNKRLRIDDSWDNNKPVDFGTCMEQFQQTAERARMLYVEKEQALVQSNMHQQLLLNECQKRDAIIEDLQTRLEETQKKDRNIYRLERELFLMKDVLDGYRKALKDVKKSFEQYRERVQLAEEPTYKDTGLGGLMLTAPALEKLRQKQAEDYKMNCLFIEQKMKEAEEEFFAQFRGYLDKVNHLDNKLSCLEANAKELAELYAKRKTAPTEENVPDSDEPEEKVPEFDEPEEKVAEFGETEGKVSKADEEEETVVIPDTNEEVAEGAAEPSPNE